jgi:hypothetical protein
MTEAEMNPIAQNRAAANAKVAEIQNDSDLNDGAKARMISEVSRAANERHEELVREAGRAREQELSRLRRGAYGLTFPSGVVREADKETYRTSYRSAESRVRDMNLSELEDEFGRAERVGDQMLIQAIYHRALDNGFGGLTQRYWNMRPDAKDQWEKYTSAKRAAEDPAGLVARALFSERPPETPPEAESSERATGGGDIIARILGQ